jgi:hypothetical protein
MQEEIMTKESTYFIVSVLLSFALQGCGGGNGNNNPKPVRIDVDFGNTLTMWQGGYSDYTTATQPTEFVAESRPLPPPFSGNGYYTLGGNRSDDLFVYIKSKFAGFKPNARYHLTFQVNFITNAPSAGCTGIGGSPASVTIKAGATAVEPMTILLGSYYTMNIDKGNQVTGGKNALALGDIGNTNTDCINLRYERKTLASTSPLEVTTDASGDLWFLFGMDSGFEGTSHIYYQSISVVATAP